MSKVHSFKKCQACGKMSHWDLEQDDKCEFCGSPLSPLPPDVEKDEAKEESSDSVLDIKPGDSGLVIFLKKTGWVIKMIFTAILTFFIWLISIVTG